MNNTVTYEDFKKNIISELESMLPGVDLDVKLIPKNNNCILDGMVMKSNDSCIFPTVYLNTLYKDFIYSGKSVRSITGELVAAYEQALDHAPDDISFITDFGKAKDNIIFHPIFAPMNRQILKEMPHITKGDLALVFRITACLGSDEVDASIPIRNEYLKYWKITEQELIKTALKNTPKIFPYQIIAMEDLLDQLSVWQENEFFPSSSDCAYPMYILSNTQKIYGAASIYYDGLLGEISDKLNDDLYIIPSSIHEVILIPAKTVGDTDVLNSMICEVNSCEVRPEEILSDHAYIYKRSTDEILSCK